MTRPIRVRLTRKLAECVDGIDLSDYREGDLLDLPRQSANLLVAEGWAVPVIGRQILDHRRTTEQLRRLREASDQRRIERDERRRAEDVIREELQDSRAKIIAARREG